MDDPRLERQQPPERGDRLRRVVLLEARDELEASGGDLEHPGDLTSRALGDPGDAEGALALVMWVTFPSGIAFDCTATRLDPRGP